MTSTRLLAAALVAAGLWSQAPVAQAQFYDSPATAEEYCQRQTGGRAGFTQCLIDRGYPLNEYQARYLMCLENGGGKSECLRDAQAVRDRDQAELQRQIEEQARQQREEQWRQQERWERERDRQERREQWEQERRERRRGLNCYAVGNTLSCY